MRDLQILLQRLGFIVSGGNTIGMYNFFAQFGERDTAYVSRASRLAAPGWDAIDIVFGDYVPARMMRDLEREMRDSYRFRYFTVTRVGGRRVWIMTLQRILRLTGVSGVAAPHPAIDPKWLYFTMPEGGTVTLTKTGSPTTVTLEVSIDNGATWSEWTESGTTRTQTLAAGQVMHVRNASDISTGFSLNGSNYYKFAFDNDTYAGGNNDSLLCKNAANAVISSYCYEKLYINCVNLITPPELPSLTLNTSCYHGMFSGCTKMEYAPDLPSTTLAVRCYDNMFVNCRKITEITLVAETLLNYCYREMLYGCSLLSKVTTRMTNISATGCLDSWLYSVAASGDFYCPQSLTINTGDASGIPAGWTRHDI